MKKSIILYMLGAVSLILAPFFNNFNYFSGTLFLIIVAVALYFSLSKIKKSYLALSNIFTAVWIGSIGLSNLKLLTYQRPWAIKTWIYLSIGYILVCIFMEIGNYFNWEKLTKGINKLDFSDTTFSQLFLLNIVLFLLSLFGFIMTVKINGFIPFFETENINAYSQFYTKFFLLSHFSIINIPLAYISFRQTNVLFLKISLFAIIIIQTFVIPILSVNRGVFLIGALILTLVIAYTSKRKFLTLIVCIFVSFSGYEIGSIGRHYTNKMLESSFKQSETVPTREPDDKVAPTDEENAENELEEKEQSEEVISYNQYGEYLRKVNDSLVVVEHSSETLHNISAKIPAKLLFLYSYLTVSHDNFDLAVKYNDSYSYGLRQLSGFKFIVNRINPALYTDLIEYRVQANLTTSNFLSTSLYDFGIIGLLVFSVLFGLLAGIVEKIYQRSNSLTSLLLLSFLFYCTVLCFYSNYTAQFIFIMNLMSLLTISILLGTVRYLKRRMK